MNGYIDIYCERLGPGIAAEPLNAATNIAFFIAAFFAYYLAKRRNALNLGSAALIFLLCAIGAGSTLFHTLATKTAQLSDVLPILLYQVCFIVLYASNVMRLNPLKTAFLFIAFMGMSAVFERVPSEILNGSSGYIPALMFLTGFGMWHARHIKQESKILLYAAMIFVLSLTFRTVDMALCPLLPIGTHFMWHLLNGLVLYLTARAYILNQDKTAKNLA